MHHFSAQRMQNNSARNNLTVQPDLFSAEQNALNMGVQLQRDRYGPNVYGQMAIHSYNEGSNGTRPSIQDENQLNQEKDQYHEQDMEIGHDDKPTLLTFEGLEQRFLDEIMKLASEQRDAEEAENTRHKEKLLEINTKYQESFSALRAQQAARREEFLRKESQARLDQCSAVTASTNNISSTSVVASSSSTTSFFKFGSTPIPSTDIIVSSSSSSGPMDTKSGQDAGFSNLKSTAFGGTSVAVGSTGSGIFGFSSSAMTAVNNQSQGSVFVCSGGPVLGTQSSATTGFAATTQSQSFQVGAGQASTAAGFATSTQENITPQNQSPFQASGSLEFNAGGGFSLSTGGGDKSGRTILRVKGKHRRK